MYDILRDLIPKPNLDLNLCMTFSNAVDLAEAAFRQMEEKEIKTKNVNLLKHKRPYNRGALEVGLFEQGVRVWQ